MTVLFGASLVPVTIGELSLVSAGASTLTLGAVVSMLPLPLISMLLPASSLMLASMLYGPSASAVGTSTEKLPLASTVVVKVCSAPKSSITVKVITVPSTASLLPLRVGVTSLLEPGLVKSSVGAMVSTSPAPVAVAVLPAASLTLALTVKLPSARAVVTGTDHVPLAPTVAVMVCAAPALSVTIIVTSLPCGASLVPEIVGVVSLLTPLSVITRLGGVKSISPVSLALPILPRPSSTSAVTVYSPCANSLGASTLHTPPVTVVVVVVSAPALSTNVKLMVVPSAASLVPLMVGVVSLVSTKVLMLMLGAVVFSVAVSLTVVVLPALSLTLASIVSSPSTSAFGTSADQLPPAWTVAVKVSVVMPSLTLMLITVPAGAFVVPLIVGVLSLVAPTVSSTSVGARLSRAPDCVAPPVLPAASVMLACTL
ncbi:hypothetical protein PSAT104721_20245 [Pseudoalteromonas atlantica]